MKESYSSALRAKATTCKSKQPELFHTPSVKGLGVLMPLVVYSTFNHKKRTTSNLGWFGKANGGKESKPFILFHGDFLFLEI